MKTDPKGAPEAEFRLVSPQTLFDHFSALQAAAACSSGQQYRRIVGTATRRGHRADPCGRSAALRSWR